jgi:hypothetical protein
LIYDLSQLHPWLALNFQFYSILPLTNFNSNAFFILVFGLRFLQFNL